MQMVWDLKPRGLNSHSSLKAVHHFQMVEAHCLSYFLFLCAASSQTRIHLHSPALGYLSVHSDCQQLTAHQWTHHFCQLQDLFYFLFQGLQSSHLPHVHLKYNEQTHHPCSVTLQ